MKSSAANDAGRLKSKQQLPDAQVNRARRSSGRTGCSAFVSAVVEAEAEESGWVAGPAVRTGECTGSCPTHSWACARISQGLSRRQVEERRASQEVQPAVSFKRTLMLTLE